MSEFFLHLQHYAGRCDVAVDTLLRLGFVTGKRRDGVWLGRAATWAMLGTRWRCDALGRPVHVWIERPDGMVVDPTRWVLEGVWPYVYEGTADLYAEAVLPLEEE